MATEVIALEETPAGKRRNDGKSGKPVCASKQGPNKLVVESLNQLAGAIVNQLGFHDLPQVSINLFQLLRRGLSEGWLLFAS